MRYLRRSIIILVCTLMIGGISYAGFHVFRKYILDIEEPHYGTVAEAKWSVILLESGEKVLLAGVKIPLNESKINYDPDLVHVVRELLLGKRIKIELTERARAGAGHKYDLVRVYMEDGTCVNTYLLENGLAFFSHGYYRGKHREFEAEKRARKEAKGIWADKEDLELLYVGSRKWEAIHYPECPEVERIAPEDRIEYYTRPVVVHWYRDGAPDICPYCQEIRKTKPDRLK